MGDRIAVPVSQLDAAAQRLRVVADVLADLDDLVVDAAALGDPAVAAATVEVQRGWHVDRALLRQHLATLGTYVDAAATAARDADATVVRGASG